LRSNKKRQQLSLLALFYALQNPGFTLLAGYLKKECKLSCQPTSGMVECMPSVKHSTPHRKMKTSNYSHPAFKIIREDIANPDAVSRLSKQLAACPNPLGDDPVFLAYCDLATLGPDNDHDGVRSTALKLKWDWELNVLAPAQAALRAAR